MDESPSSSSAVILSSSFLQPIVFKAPVIFFENKRLAVLSRCGQRAAILTHCAILEGEKKRETERESDLDYSSCLSNSVFFFLLHSSGDYLIWREKKPNQTDDEINMACKHLTVCCLSGIQIPMYGFEGAKVSCLCLPQEKEVLHNCWGEVTLTETVTECRW